jgi:hypothetical protein
MRKVFLALLLCPFFTAPAPATVVFLVVGLMHALRLFFGWHADVKGWIVPQRVSWVGLVIGLYLASDGIGLAKKDQGS